MGEEDKFKVGKLLSKAISARTQRAIERELTRGSIPGMRKEL